MRKMIAAGVAALGVTLTLSACSDEGTKTTQTLSGDALFLSLLEERGMADEYTDDGAISIARTLCEANDGRSGTTFVEGVMKSNSNWAYPGKEREFAEAAFAAYCPGGSATSSSSTSAAATTTLRRGEITNADRAFLASLDSYWTDGADRADLIEVGTQLCDKLQGGADKMDVLKAVLPETGSADKGINLLHSAVVAYCPDQLTGIK